MGYAKSLYGQAQGSILYELQSALYFLKVVVFEIQRARTLALCLGNSCSNKTFFKALHCIYVSNMV